MQLANYSKEQLQEMSLIEIAYELLKERKQTISFKELMDEVSKLLKLNKNEVADKIAQFYTDLNIDGRFLALGENTWGLRVWYPVDQIEEETVTTVKPKKKKAKKVLDEDDLELEDYDELDEDDLDFDDEDDFEEDEEIEDELIEEDEDLIEVDLEKDEDFDEEEEELIEEAEYEFDEEETDEEEVEEDEE